MECLRVDYAFVKHELIFFWSARWFSRDFSFTARTILWGSRIEICFVSCFPSFQIALTSSVK